MVNIVGKKVKFKDYIGKGNSRGFNTREGWIDWQQHKNQIGTITLILDGHGNFDYQLVWNDGVLSAVPKDNMILVGSNPNSGIIINE